MPNVECIVAGVVLIVGGVHALLSKEPEYRGTPQYHSLEWLSELPTGERLMSCLSLVWVSAAAGGILRTLSRGRLSTLAYIAFSAALFVAGWLLRTKLDRFWARALQNSLNYQYARKGGGVMVAIGLALCIAGLML
jgi:hypothetical protein